MPTRLIELSDGLLVEVETTAEAAQPISGGLAERVAGSMDKARPAILHVCNSVADVCRQMAAQVNVERAELELGLSFEAEGNVYITRTTGSASLVVRLILNPQR